MKNNEQKSYFSQVTTLSKTLAFVLFITLPFVGFFLGLTYSKQSSIPADVPNGNTPGDTETTSTWSNEGAVTPTTATGYIVAINKDEVVVDYIDVLFDQKALEAMIADGYCKKGALLDECFDSTELYDRNADPTLRTFKLSPSVSIISGREVKLTTDMMAKYFLAYKISPSKYSFTKFPDAYHGSPFMITFNSKNEVIKIEERFRP